MIGQYGEPNEAPMTPTRTSLTVAEQADFRAGIECGTATKLCAIIRRLDADLVKMTEIADDAIKDANLSHEQIDRLDAARHDDRCPATNLAERLVRLTARVGELEGALTPAGECPSCITWSEQVDILTAQVARLREVLTPFAKLAEAIASGYVDPYMPCSMKVAELTAASAALREDMTNDR